MVLLVVAAAPGAAPAGSSPPPAALFAAKSLRCEFLPGEYGNWFASRWEITDSVFSQSPILIDGIDLAGHTARMTGPKGVLTVQVLATGEGLHFVAHPSERQTTFTSVFARNPNGVFPAVHALRTVAFFGDVTSAQFYGSCEAAGQ